MTPRERDDLLIRLEERQNATMDKVEEIRILALKTNGRVTELEKWQATHKGSTRTKLWLITTIIAMLGVLATLATVFINK